MDGSDIGALSDVRIGRIIAVSASQAVALLERCDPSSASERDWPVEMGALVKMQTRVSTVYGMVSGLRVPLPNLSPSDQELRSSSSNWPVRPCSRRMAIPARSGAA